jgi:hypothetical protein
MLVGGAPRASILDPAGGAVASLREDRAYLRWCPLGEDPGGSTANAVRCRRKGYQVKRSWAEEERWSDGGRCSPDELTLVGDESGPTTLGFAVMLRFFAGNTPPRPRRCGR